MMMENLDRPEPDWLRNTKRMVEVWEIAQVQPVVN